MDAREAGEKILREAGLSAEDAAESLRAQDAIDRRLAGLGLSATTSPPRKVPPAPRFLGAGSGASAVLFDPEGPGPNPSVVPADVEESDALFELTDLVAAQAVTGLATTAAGGTEVRFTGRGYVHVGSGAIGVYYNRAIGASQNTRWIPCAPGQIIPFNNISGLFVGTNIVGGIRAAGVLTLSFYQLPPTRTDRPDTKMGTISAGRGAPGSDPRSGAGRFAGIDLRSPGAFRTALASRLTASGSDMPTGALIAAVGGGTDVTLGSFSDAGAGTQIALAGSNMPVAGASVAGETVLNSRPANTDTVWVGETAALRVASNNPIGPSGQDTWRIPVGGTLFILALSGTQVVSARYRS